MGAVGLQGVCHGIAPSSPWSASGSCARVPLVVGTQGWLVGRHAYEVTKPLDPLSLNVVQDGCSSYHVSDHLVSDHVPSGLVHCFPQTLHFACYQFLHKG